MTSHIRSYQNCKWTYPRVTSLICKFLTIVWPYNRFSELHESWACEIPGWRKSVKCSYCEVVMMDIVLHSYDKGFMISVGMNRRVETRNLNQVYCQISVHFFSKQSTLSDKIYTRLKQCHRISTRILQRIFAALSSLRTNQTKQDGLRSTRPRSSVTLQGFPTVW